jgi:hypothetical protein
MSTAATRGIPRLWAAAAVALAVAAVATALPWYLATASASAPVPAVYFVTSHHASGHRRSGPIAGHAFTGLTIISEGTGAEELLLRARPALCRDGRLHLVHPGRRGRKAAGPVRSRRGTPGESRREADGRPECGRGRPGVLVACQKGVAALAAAIDYAER